MAAVEQITELLNQPLSRENVKARRGESPKPLSYIESHHAIREANRIFGFFGWNSETLEVTCFRETADEVWYRSRVRVTVLCGDRVVFRDGTGYGDAKNSRNLGKAHEKAMKEAESDAQKRAFRQFGDQFGLALYDKDQEHVVDVPAQRSDPDQEYINRVVADREPPVSPTRKEKEEPRQERPSQPQASNSERAIAARQTSTRRESQRSATAERQTDLEEFVPPGKVNSEPTPAAGKQTYEELCADIGKIKATLMTGREIHSGRAAHEFAHWETKARNAWGLLSVGQKRLIGAHQRATKILVEEASKRGAITADDVAEERDGDGLEAVA